ncbi:hypothetical protein PVK06_008350 [Gossypium arboreum]|uniref:Aminotransferase-like plant mobile domain-containing protein n=1 Tax=Gossypium arboreum TaxID=29729 RepID=A0ABR0QJY3_GOSAR|nr:hypothetical protein PVK06_008350 [Gossypium arboreum]
MAGCLGLLQSWALYRMPFLAAVRHQPYSWPLINSFKWATSPGIGASQTLIICRQMIEAYAREKFLWMSYSALNIATHIPQWVHAKAQMWCINKPVFSFLTVEWYNGDRVMQQFGCRQFVSVEPHKTMRGKHTTDWSVEHQFYVALWNARYDKLLEMHFCLFDFSPSTEYMQWYMTRWRIYLYGGQLIMVPGHGYRRGNQPMGELADQHMAEPDLEAQPLNTLDQWVNAFCDESQSSSYHLDIGSSSSYHPNMGVRVHITWT